MCAAIENERVALVTGGAKGLGLGAVRRLLRDRWKVVVLDLYGRPDDAAAPAETEVIWRVGDVSSESDVAGSTAEAIDRFGRLDLVLANAGIGQQQMDLADLAVEEFDRVLRVNLRGVFLTCREGARVMRPARRGSIVATTSIYAQEPVPREGAYNASKAAIIALVQTLSWELAPFAIRVNAIAPGYMMTEGLRGAQEDRARHAGVSSEEQNERVNAMIPLHRHGTPEDFGNAVAFLASDEASYITGHTLGVTGGLVRR